jgi:hypothetical protein
VRIIEKIRLGISYLFEDRGSFYEEEMREVMCNEERLIIGFNSS